MLRVCQLLVVSITVQLLMSTAVQAIPLAMTQLAITQIASSGESVISIVDNHGIRSSDADLHFGGINFEQQQNFKVVSLGSRLHARGFIQSGKKQVDVYWQVARLDQPFLGSSDLSFESIGDVARVQSSKSFFLSPALPTQQQGIYVVQLVASSGEIYSLHYQVSTDLKQSLLAPASINLLSPAPRQAVSVSMPTDFLWVTDLPVAAYRFELYFTSSANHFDQLSSPPSYSNTGIGLLIDAHQSKLQLDQALIKRLPRSGRYFWRVVGLSLDGTTICRSQLQLVTLQL